MRAITSATLGCLLALSLGPAAWSQSPQFQSLSPEGTVVWTNPVTGNLSIFERTSDFAGGVWEPFFYDWGTNGLLTTRLPWATADASMFYRVGVRTNIPDPSLVMHLSFDNDFPAGTVLDLSGHGNHGRRYGRPGFPTNWPSLTSGPDGSRAAQFHWYSDGYGLYGKTGDYIGIPITPSFLNMTQATISVWAHYYTSLGNNIANDHNSTLMNSGHIFPGTFFFGRSYSSQTSFIVTLGSQSAQEPIVFPDNSPIGNSGGWHHYVITFDAGLVKGYFDGKLIGTGNVATSALTAAGQYIGISCWTFNVTPELDLSVDGHPNNAWINGAVDDVRIFRRVLDAGEISTLHRSFDKLPPTVPGNLVAEASASSLVTLRWNVSQDLYGVSNYVVLRDDQMVGETTNTVFFDSGLLPDTAYSYTLRARDIVGHLSAPTPPALVSTRPVDGGVVITLDDADGSPWISQTGVWATGYITNTVLTGIYRTTFVSDERIDKGKTFTFTPPLPETGDYDVYFWHPGKADATHLFSTVVPVDIVSGTSTNTVFVNQRVGFGQWKLLGRFPLAPGAHVRLRTAGTSTSHYVMGDAVRFVK